MKLYNLGTTTLKDKEYTIKDNTGLRPIEEIANTSFYGGRIKKYSRTKDNENIILLIEEKEDKFIVTDLAVSDLLHVPRETLKDMAKRRGKKFSSNISTEDLAKLVK